MWQHVLNKPLHLRGYFVSTIKIFNISERDHPRPNEGRLLPDQPRADDEERDQLPRPDQPSRGGLPKQSGDRSTTRRRRSKDQDQGRQQRDGLAHCISAKESRYPL